MRYKIKIRCPGCGYYPEKEVDYIPNVLEAICSKCHTRFSITYNNGADEARRAFMLAEDHEDSDLVIIQG